METVQEHKRRCQEHCYQGGEEGVEEGAEGISQLNHLSLSLSRARGYDDVYMSIVDQYFY